MAGIVSVVAHGKGMLVKGDTKPLKECLKNLGGRWNPALTAWILPTKKKDELVGTVCKHKAVKSFINCINDGPADKNANAQQEGLLHVTKRECEGGAASCDGRKNEVVIDIDECADTGTLLRVSIKMFRGRCGIDLRSWCIRGKDKAETKPSVNGIFLWKKKWEALKDTRKEIEEIRKISKLS